MTGSSFLKQNVFALFVEEATLITVKHRLDAGRQVAVRRRHSSRTQRVVRTGDGQCRGRPLTSVSVHRMTSVAVNRSGQPRIRHRGRRPSAQARRMPLLQLLTSHRQLGVGRVGIRMMEDGSRNVVVAVKVRLVKAWSFDSRSRKQRLRKTLNGGVFDFASDRSIFFPTSLAGCRLCRDCSLTDGLAD